MSSIVQAKTGKLWMLFNRRTDSTARGLGFEPNPGGRRRLPPSPCTSHTASQSHHSGKLHMPRAQLGNPRHREPACPSRRTSTSCMIRTGTNTSNSAMTSVLRAQPRPDRRRVLPVVRGAPALLQRLGQPRRCVGFHVALRPGGRQGERHQRRGRHHELAVQRRGEDWGGHGEADGDLGAARVGVQATGE